MIWIKNGGYVSYMYLLFLHLLKGDVLIACSMTIRLFTINYFFWFCEWSYFGQLRQFVRFTDSQTVLCLLYWLYDKNNDIEEITYNILAIVTFGFWVAKMFGIDETLVAIKYPFIQDIVTKFYHYINHGLLLLIISPLYRFSINGIKNTLLFILMYLMLIYIPWYFFTEDRVYDI